MIAQATRRPPRARRALARVRVEIRLTAQAIWRGLTGVYNSDDLTFASSIAYYALLSLFPFFLLALSLVALVTDSQSDRDALLGFVFRYFPRQFDFVEVQLAALQRAHCTAGRRWQRADGVGRDGRLRRCDVRRQPRVGR